MKKLLSLSLIIFLSINMFSQDKRGHKWLFGNNGQIASFVGDTSRPTTNQLFWSGPSPNYPYAFTGGHSNICDSATGEIVLLSNGMQLFDTVGNIIENGDSLVPLKMFTKNAYPNAPFTQGSLILPKGDSGLYYVMIPTATDSTYDTYWTNSTGLKFPYDEILVHTVDMNANGGMGKVIEKNKKIINNVELSPTLMQACKHSNGVDWWLLKQGLDSNIIFRFLITEDTISGPYIQSFPEPHFGYFEGTGQSAFNKDGTKYAVVKGKSNKLFVADFDRCSGELSNPKVFNIPIDSTSYPYADSIGLRDSISSGVCFSLNDQYVYVSKWWNLYQFEYGESDSSLAWYNIKRGTDTTWDAFEYYGALKMGVDNRIYIGKGAGGFKQLSVIDKPDEKGVACNFCRKCLRIDNGGGGSTAPPNMPDYTLGASGQLCWPLGANQFTKPDELEVYPNPTSDKVNIKYINNSFQKIKVELYDAVGQMIFSTYKTEIDVSRYNKGVYYIKVGNAVKKLIIE